MTKAKATRAQLPAQTNDAAPPPDADTPDPAAGTPPGYVAVTATASTMPPDAPVNPVHDEAGAPPPPPPDDPVPPEPRLPAVLASFTRLEQVRSLPEVVGDVDTQPVEFAPGTIQRFKAGETDRRTLEVIALPGQGFAARAVVDTPQEA